jgi:hypothetical protein
MKKTKSAVGGVSIHLSHHVVLPRFGSLPVVKGGFGF